SRGGIMRYATVNGVELEYESRGSGEPVLLISPVLADGFMPLVAEPALSDRYQLVRYHKRGWCGSTHTTTPTSVADHAADAAPPPDHLPPPPPPPPPPPSATPAAPPSPPSSPSTNLAESPPWHCSSCRSSRCPAGG